MEYMVTVKKVSLVCIHHATRLLIIKQVNIKIHKWSF